MVNRAEIRVVGMSRSGNHAIVEWLLAQARGRWCHLNCAEPSHNPFEWARPLADDATGHSASYDLDIEAERAGRLSRKDLLVHTYEDVLLHHFSDPDDEARLREWVGTSARRVDMLILRDPYNLFASRRAARAGIVPDAMAVDVWCRHARELLGETSHLGNERVLVSYNRWASSRAYRARIARMLGLTFDDRAAAVVPRCAGGSSFDGVLYDGAAGEMDVAQRWRRFADDAGFARMFTPDVHRLAARAFGDLPAAPRLAA